MATPQEHEPITRRHAAGGSDEPLAPEEHLEPEDEQQVVEGARLPARVVYEIVRRDGLEELERPVASLVWSGVAAGLVISFSVICMALLNFFLPDAHWTPLVASFGYSFGFLLTILGRLQLFTENTITTVIPLAHWPSWRMAGATLRLWSVVFAANLVGTFFAALFIAESGAFTPEFLGEVGELSHHMMALDTDQMFTRGIPSGILVAAIVWVLPSAAGTAIWVILFFTYVIALGGFTHIVAGSTEAFFLLLRGEIGLGRLVGHFLLPVFAGNVVGGTAVFAMLAYAQVKREIDLEDPYTTRGDEF
jgi:formate-nitrite transporter family protein